MPLNFERYNEAVKQWGSANRTRFQTIGRSMGIQHRESSPSTGESLGRIREKYQSDSDGVINKVSFGNINRSLIYTQEGAGKGIGGSKGSRWIDKYGTNKKTNPASLGKAGSGSRTSKPWINTTLDSAEGLEQLGDIVAEHQADAIIESVYLK
jgi:hypothetical protein